MIFFENEQDKEEFNDEIENTIVNIIEYSLKHEDFNYNYELSITIVDNDGIRIINREFRNIDKPTDVLSFPMIEYNGEYYKSGYKLDPQDINPDGTVILGDIVLSLERAKEQCIEYGHSFLREVAFLTLHSVLHLLGHDHEIESDRIIMRGKEEKILESLSYKR